MTDIAVVGGGVSGLAAAWELSAHPDVHVTVVESSNRLGGKIRTEPFVGREVDLGPDAFLRRVPDALALCAEIGLDDLIAPAHGTARVYLDGALVPIPTGLVLGAPAHFDDLDRSTILSAAGLERAHGEAGLAGLPIDEDAAIGGLIRARYGDEVAERLVGPLLGGIAAGDLDEMSLDACAPQLAAAARQGPSMTAALRSALESTTSTAGVEPVFAAPRGGMEVLISTLVERLRERGVEFRLNTPVDRLPDADGVVLSADAALHAKLLRDRVPEAAQLLSSIEFASVVFTAIAFAADDLPTDLDASGFLVPRGAGLTVTAASWSSTKWAHLAGDPAILRVSMGHRHDHRSIDASDDEVIATIRRDLNTTMGITAAPVDVRIARFRKGFPQYRVGHLELTERVEQLLATGTPRVALCGMAHRGVGIPACVREARRAASGLIDRVQNLGHDSR
ncbi:MAG: protoporphyrinogen oxidase [Microthrixaceae bacterium]|nr:protoporphyrinogen oxidase [Microthrixaceae bacterium]